VRAGDATYFATESIEGRHRVLQCVGDQLLRDVGIGILAKPYRLRDHLDVLAEADR
jgi:hypothetical protein